MPLFGVVLAGLLPMTSGTAQAAIKSFDLVVVDPTADLGSGLFGTVKVSENAGALDFSIALQSGFAFHAGNAKHSAFAFSLLGDPTVTITNLPTGFSRSVGTTFSEPPFGSGWDYAISCCGLNDKNKKIVSLPGTLEFEVKATSGLLSLASLLPHDVTVGDKSYSVYFTSDVIDLRPRFRDDDHPTGNVGAVASAVPEPSTWAMMLLGLIGIGAFARRRSRKSRALAA